MQFKKKPVVIDAVQWYPARGITDPAFADLLAGKSRFVGGGKLEIATLEGPVTASPGDWIIKGVAGEFYPCKPDIFERTYEPVDGVCPVPAGFSADSAHGMGGIPDEIRQGEIRRNDPLGRGRIEG